VQSDQLDNGSSQASRKTDSSARQTLWNIPNQLTVARLVLSAVFFVLLALETHRMNLGHVARSTVLNISTLVFVLAVVTDFLDGYLARKWGLTSTFGRIADPFADKIVICGGFVMLTGIAPRLVEPWFAVLILVREFLVSGLRSFLESSGVAFGAVFLGKLKMVVQSIAIPLVLLYIANLASIPEDSRYHALAHAFRWTTVACLAATLVLTVASCVGYLRRAIQLLSAREQ
jgi:CDP-diacylglycerol--glycerol-3-phosphate 3-phosphatidyltransferase